MARPASDPNGAYRHHVAVMLNDIGLVYLDQLRDEMPRGAYLRKLLTERYEQQMVKPAQEDSEKKSKMKIMPSESSGYRQRWSNPRLKP